MSCDLEPFEVGQKAVHRVGRSPRPWSFTPWRYAEGGVFQGRWDDPLGKYRVLYVAASAFGSFVEILADFRPDPVLIAGLAEIEDGEEAEEATSNIVPPGHVPTSWLRERALASGHLTGVFADVSHSRSLTSLRRDLAKLVVKSHLSELDASAVRVSAPREFTQQISRYISLCLEEGRPQFDGIYYRSRHGDDLENWAIFERGGQQLPLMPGLARSLSQKDDELRRAMEHHRLRWFVDT